MRKGKGFTPHLAKLRSSELIYRGESENSLSRKPCHKRRGAGFTLIEMIVVLAIMGLMMGMSIPYFARFTRGIKLKSAASNISTVLQTARSYAVTERKNFLVVINDEIEGDLYYAVKIYRTGDDAETVGKWQQLPQGIEIVEVSSGFSKESYLVAVPFPNDSDAPQLVPMVQFKPNGGVEHSGYFYIKDTDDNYRKIEVNNVTGRVKITNEKPE